MSSALLALALAGAAPVWPPEPNDRALLSAWMDAYFQRIQTACQIKLKPKKKGASLVPDDVRGWQALQQHWDETVTVQPQASLNNLFATVYRRNSDTFTALPNPLGVTWGTSSGPILYLERDQARRQHNCVTLLATRADAKLGLSIVDVQGALSSAYDRSGTLTTFLYSGTMVSPLTASLRLNTAVTARPPNVEPFSVLLSIWNWYRTQPDMVPLGDARRLEIYDTIDGVAAQTVSGMTQKSLIEGSARASLIIPFFSAGTAANGSVTGDTSYQVQEFAVARWNGQTRLLPSAAEVVRSAAVEALFRPAAGNVPGIDTAQPFPFTFELSNVPSAYCSALFWSQQPASFNQSADMATGTLTSVSPSPDDASMCRFTMDVTPPAKAATGVTIPLTVRSQLGGAAADAPVLLLAAKPVTIADYRSAFALVPPVGERQLAFQPGDPAPRTLSVTLPIRELYQARPAISVQPGSLSVTTSCGRGRSLNPIGAVQLARGDGGASLSLSMTFSPSVLQASQTCQVGGSVTIRSGGANSAVTVGIPTFDIVLSALEPPGTVPPA
jgi:hypothetical protein